MATATLDRKPATDGGRKFKIIKGQVGPWHWGNVFDEREFKRLNVIPDTQQAKDQIDPETYHGDLIERLLALEVIAHAPDAEVTPTPIGPESSVGRPVLNASIQAAVKEALEARDREAARKAALPPPSTSQEVAPVMHGGMQRAR